MPIAPVLLLLFFFSGATALIYEVVWVRILSLTFGNTVFAIGVVLIAFMSGLSLGSFIFGRWADSGKNLLKGYGVLEFGIACSALLSPLLLEYISSVYLSISPISMPIWLLSVLRFSFSTVILLIPTTLMGGTLPVLSRHFIRSQGDIEKRVGMLYSVNTIGGVIGTFLVGFFMIRLFGMNLTIKSTALINILIGAVAFYLGHRGITPKPANHSREKEPPQKLTGYRYAAVAIFVSGFAAMIYEVAWSRLLISVIGSTTYAFSLVLMGFLMGIGLGSLIVSYLSGKHKRMIGLGHFSAIQLSVGVICSLSILFYKLLPKMMFYGLRTFNESYTSILGIQFSLVLLFILIPTTLMGATFPIIAGIYNSGENNTGRNIGIIYASNTSGAILGSAVAAFFLLPVFGSTISIKVAAFFNITIGVIGILVLKKTRIFPVTVALLIVPFLPLKIPFQLIDTGVAIYGHTKGFSIDEDEGFYYLFQKEGLNANISVSADQSGNISLRTNGKTDASIGSDMVTQLAAGYFPLILHPKPRDVFIVGLGSGVTARAISDYAPIREIEVAEIEPAVVDAADFFERVNNGVHRKPPVSIITDDARSYIIASEKFYDIIISEPSNPWISGIGSLYTKDFYEIVASKLRKGGIFCQWVQLYGLRTNEIRMILNTFNSVFDETSLWQGSVSDLLIIGSQETITPFNYREIEKNLALISGNNLKAYFNIEDPMDFLSYYITDRKNTEILSSNANINTDDLPLLEFNAPLAIYSNLYAQNRSAIYEHVIVPEIEGYDEAVNIPAEFHYRKSRNSLNLGLPLDLSWIQTAISLDNNNTNYKILYAAILGKFNRSMEAIDLLESILALEPENRRALFELARLIMPIDKNEADIYFSKASIGEEADFEIIFTVAKHKLESGKFVESQQFFKKAAKLPHKVIDDSLILYYIGLCSMKLHDYENAIYYFEQSVATTPFFFNSAFSLADSYMLTGNVADACKFYEKALEVAYKDRREKIEGRLHKYCQ